MEQERRELLSNLLAETEEQNESTEGEFTPLCMVTEGELTPLFSKSLHINAFDGLAK